MRSRWTRTLGAVLFAAATLVPAILAAQAVTSADAKPFLDYLKTIQARPAFEKQGFTVLVKSVTSA